MDDFNVSHLEGNALNAAKTIVKTLNHNLGRKPSGGGCKAFYSQSEWIERKEKYGSKALLILCHDGGDLAPFCNLDYCAYESYEALQSAMNKKGFYIEQCTSWYSAVYQN